MSRLLRSEQRDMVQPPAFNSQPGGYQPPNTTCPPGLEYLTPLDIVFMDQRVDPFEVVTGIHVANRYTIVDVRGQPLYVIREQSNWFMRFAFGRSRAFEMPIYDKNGREALLIKRPLRLVGDSMEVYCYGNELLGTIVKTVLSCAAHFRIYDENGIEKLQIRGPQMWLTCGCTFEFAVVAPNGRHIGTIQKQWSGAGREIFTNADIFGVSFERNLSVKVKAMLLAAAILIDFGYFEQRS